MLLLLSQENIVKERPFHIKQLKKAVYKEEVALALPLHWASYIFTKHEQLPFPSTPNRTLRLVSEGSCLGIGPCLFASVLFCFDIYLFCSVQKFPPGKNYIKTYFVLIGYFDLLLTEENTTSAISRGRNIFVW